MDRWDSIISGGMFIDKKMKYDASFSWVHWIPFLVQTSHFSKPLRLGLYEAITRKSKLTFCPPWKQRRTWIWHHARFTWYPLTHLHTALLLTDHRTGGTLTMEGNAQTVVHVFIPVLQISCTSVRIWFLPLNEIFHKSELKCDTYNDHVANVPAAELRVGGVLHVDDPADDEDAQPCQEEVLHLNGWETTLRGGRWEKDYYYLWKRKPA